MNKHNLTRLFLLTTFLFTPFSLFAADKAVRLEKEALTFLQEHYKKAKPDARTEIKVNPISRKIKLKNCLEALNFQTPRGNGNRITFRVRCPSPYWQLFITAEIKLFGSAVISQKSLHRKNKLQLNELALSEVELTNIRSAYFTNPADVAGSIIKRSIPAGTVITANMLTPPKTILKGNALIIEANRSGVSIRTSGTALQDGSVGDQIKARNDRSGRVVKGVIIEPGLIRVP